MLREERGLVARGERLEAAEMLAVEGLGAQAGLLLSVAGLVTLLGVSLAKVWPAAA